jgi:hypothetical protein
LELEGEAAVGRREGIGRREEEEAVGGRGWDAEGGVREGDLDGDWICRGREEGLGMIGYCSWFGVKRREWKEQQIRSGPQTIKGDEQVCRLEV